MSCISRIPIVVVSALGIMGSLLATVALASSLVFSAGECLTFRSGEHTIDSTVDQCVDVLNDATATVVRGAAIAGRVSAFNTARVVFTGGVVEDAFVSAYAHDEAELVLNGGVFAGLAVADECASLTVAGTALIHGGVNAQGESRVRIEGGQCCVRVQAFDDALLTITQQAAVESAFAYGTSHLMVEGGLIDNSLFALDAAMLMLSGGQVIGGGLQVEGFATIEVFGSEFNHPFGPLDGGNGQVVGLLADGTPIDVPFFQFDDGTIILSPPPCSADLNRNGEVEGGDLLMLLGSWGTEPDGPPDFDGDGNVGTTDLLILLGAWGPCP